MARRSFCCCQVSARRSTCRTWASQVLHDLPGVGSNLHDHFNTYCAWRISRSLSLNVLHHSIPHQLVAGAKYVFWRGGPMSGNGLYVGALVRSDPALERPDLQMNISAWSTIDRTRDGIISHPFPGIRHQSGASAAGRSRHRAAEKLRIRWRRRRSASTSCAAITTCRRSSPAFASRARSPASRR